MQDRPLLISTLIDFAADYHGAQEIVTRTVEGPVHRMNYRELRHRAKQVAQALLADGAQVGDRIATLAWNTHRHLELYYGVSGMGAVLHTVNPRLFADQIEYIINHAGDTHLFFDLTFLPIVEKLAPTLPQVKHFVLLTDKAHLPAAATIPNLIAYEDWIGAQDGNYAWPMFDENTASSLCYTSGTTGNPKGVLYSHRSTFLHSYAACARDGLDVSSSDSILLIVPLFHANAWGIPYAGTMAGAKLVLVGAKLDGQSVFELMRDEQCNYSLGVPTVWLSLFQYLDQNPSLDLSGIKLSRVAIGGSAAPRAMIERFARQFNTYVIHAWGMTEMSPIGTIGNLLPKHRDLPLDERIAVQVKQGRAVCGVDLKIVDDDGEKAPRDGKTSGNLVVRGPWIAKGYFREEGGAILDEEGYFPTGDVANLDEDGYLQLTDRSKDVIKSGGEWISSIDLENAAVGHPDVQEAAVIGVTHPKWQERPLLLVTPKVGTAPSKEDILKYLETRVAKWWLPEDVIFVEQLPHTATGKLLKMKLRAEYRDYLSRR